MKMEVFQRPWLSNGPAKVILTKTSHFWHKLAKKWRKIGKNGRKTARNGQNLVKI